MIDSLNKQVVYRYEWVYMHDAALVETSVQQHVAVIVALKEHNLEQAIEQLEAHWRFGMEVLLHMHFNSMELWLSFLNRNTSPGNDCYLRSKGHHISHPALARSRNSSSCPFC
jgi:hypothetical protein